MGFLFSGLVLASQAALAQDRLKTMPGYETFQKNSKEIPGSVKRGELAGTWVNEGKAFEFQKDGKPYRFDVATKATTEVKPEDGKKTESTANRPGGRRRRGGGGGGPERGRQFDSTLSPDGLLKAFHRDRNLWLSDAKGAVEKQITTDGSEKSRVKSATASWVYGEELYQTTAMWWSPDSKKIAYYRFDETGVLDYFVALDQTQIQSKVDVEAYPKAGSPNPLVDLYVYDTESKKTTRIDVRDGKPFENNTLGYYVYNVRWSPDGTELLFHRTNRRQNILEFTAADPNTGKTRLVVRDEWPESWVENLPTLEFLADGKRFIWSSERTGWKNFYFYDMSGTLLNPLTKHEFEVESIVKVDETAGLLYYMARSGDNPMKLQLHRVKLDGTSDERLTDPALNHRVDIAPDGKHFIDVAQTHDQAPVTRVVEAVPGGKVVAELAKSDLSKFESLGLRKVELITYKADDGKTDLYGLLHFPSHFDAEKKYPLLVSVYGGPATNGAQETFMTPNPLTEFGFLVATLDSRSAAGRGKLFLDAIYLKLGTVEMDDQAAGVKSLWSRSYLDKEHVGIFGTSYGGTASAMCLLRHPEVFHAASAASAVTDWRNYDTIYTERYMATPQENKEGYDAGSVVKAAAKLKGRLMLFYGTADNNVHPSNTMQFVQALQTAGKSFELQVGPDQGHAAIGRDRMMEFFIENLVLSKP